MRIDADTLVADTGIPLDAFRNALVAATVDCVFDDACDLTTLGDCSPEDFENRAIRLGGGRFIKMRHAYRSHLQLLAEQLTAAGLPIPATLAAKLATQGEPA